MIVDSSIKVEATFNDIPVKEDEDDCGTEFHWCDVFFGLFFRKGVAQYVLPHR